MFCPCEASDDATHTGDRSPVGSVGAAARRRSRRAGGARASVGGGGLGAEPDPGDPEVAGDPGAVPDRGSPLRCVSGSKRVGTSRGRRCCSRRTRRRTCRTSTGSWGRSCGRPAEGHWRGPSGRCGRPRPAKPLPRRRSGRRWHRRRRSAAPEAISLATVCAVTAALTFGSSLLSQNAGYVADAFGASDKALDTALLFSRVGVLIALVAAAMADRKGRRTLMLVCLAGVCLANAIGALAPNLVVFTAAQVLMRGFASGGLIVAGIAAVEEAPEGARAYSVALLGLAGGFGYAFAVTLLPVSGPRAAKRGVWRSLLSAASALLLPSFARRLAETRRYAGLGGPARTPRPSGRALRPLLREPLRGAGRHRLPLRHLRARRRRSSPIDYLKDVPGLLGPRHHHLPGDHPGIPRTGRHRHRRSPGRDPGPAPGGGHRPVHRYRRPDDLLPLRQRRAVAVVGRGHRPRAGSPRRPSGRSTARCSRPRSGAPPTPS